MSDANGAADRIGDAFGTEPFSGRAGLYLAASEGQQIVFEGMLGCVALIEPDCVAGGLFSFFGLPLLLFVQPEGPPQTLVGLQFKGQQLDTTRPLLRPHKLAPEHLPGLAVPE